MTIVRGNKYRLYPNATQKALLHEMFGLSRFVYNQTLGQIKDSKYGSHIANGKEYPKIPDQLTLIKSGTKLKSDYPFVSRLPSDFMQASLANLYAGFDSFFKGNGYPKFKSRKKRTQSINMQAGSRVKIIDNYIQLPKTSNSPYSKSNHLIKFKKHKTKHDIGKITGFTISKDNLDRYWISINSKFEVDSFRPKTNKQAGIDLGIKELLIASDGLIIHNDNLIKKSEIKLAKRQKQLSRKKKGSKNRNKARLKVAKTHDKINNQRNFRNHNVSRKLINIYDFIGLETLKVKSMMKNRGLSKAIANVSWSDLVTKMKYKADENQVSLVQIDTYFPSSKTCSRCGSIKKNLTLADRTYVCSECGFEMDRDLNASINILNEATRLRDNGLIKKKKVRKRNKLRRKPLVESIEQNSSTSSTSSTSSALE